MSRDHVELVRRIYAEGLIDGDDPGWLAELAAEDIRLINPSEAVEPGIREGREGVLLALVSVRSAFPGGVHELRECFDAGDRVVASVRFRARGRGSEIEVVQDECHTWAFAGGKIVSFEWGRDLAVALEAARNSS